MAKLLHSSSIVVIIPTLTCCWYTVSRSQVAFIQGKLLVKSATYDRTLGGKNFDWVIVDFLGEKYLEKYKKDPRQNIKARWVQLSLQYM